MKQLARKYISSLFFTPRFFIAGILVVALMVLRFFADWLGILPFIALITFIALAIIEYGILFIKDKAIIAQRNHAERFSNGDENPVHIFIDSRYNFKVTTKIIDEIPVQFQDRNILFATTVLPNKTSIIHYTLRPVKRGSYRFGKIYVYVSAMIGFIERRFSFLQEKEVAVYPSFLQMRKYQLMAINNRLSEAGLKRQRRLGHSMEFEQIKEYVNGDDYRTVNWKATARKGALMVNNYVEEKSQQVFCVIDKGRLMEMPFEDLSLLDYSINASLVLSSIALQKEDRVGVITFAHTIDTLLAAEKKPAHIQKIQEVLYHQKTKYLESDFEKLYITIRRKIAQRSLIVLFTNFASIGGLKRQLPYLKKISKNHLLVVVFFENAEMSKVLETRALNLKEVYTQAVVEQFELEKKQIVYELKSLGILSILSKPRDLTVNVLNKYLEIKTRQML